jgi:hypothetical protein
MTIGRSGRARVHSLRDQFPLQKGGDADGRSSRAEEHEAIGRETPSLPACGEEAGQDDRTGALDVVVEARSPVAIAIEEADGASDASDARCYGSPNVRLTTLWIGTASLGPRHSAARV